MIRGSGRMARLRPWLFLAPALAVLGLCLVYPLAATVWLSLHDRGGERFVGAANFAWLVRDPAARVAAVNTVLWLMVVPAVSTLLGLILAALTNRIGWGALARMLIFLPGAISLPGAVVIWKFVYDLRPGDSAQVGALNALVTALGAEPRAWIALPVWNSLLLMAILIWVQTGFALVILSAALRAVPRATVEAARLDGADGVRGFLLIEVPQIRRSIAVVWTAITLASVKVFDIVLVMTNGQWNTNVLANLMFDWMFRGGGDSGRGAVLALALLALTAPILAWSMFGARTGRAGQGE